MTPSRSSNKSNYHVPYHPSTILNSLPEAFVIRPLHRTPLDLALRKSENLSFPGDKQAELAKLVPLLDVIHIEANHRKITATQIVQQINWHRQFVEKGVILQKTLIGGMSKADKVMQLIAAVTRFHRDILPKLQLLAAAAMTSGAAGTDFDSPMADIVLVENWDAQDDLDDADMLDDY
ncbi:hypothetical protein B0H14DRAFT_2567350 [Mycena olivaceomarginata]|nr:hypothetical protein B0H14DRAFT_2567350 [Mycena olivaceomarginata]